MGSILLHDINDRSLGTHEPVKEAQLGHTSSGCPLVVTKAFWTATPQRQECGFFLSFANDGDDDSS